MPIRCVTFDWGDTLATNYGMPYAETNRRAFRRLGADLTALGHPPAAGWVESWLAEMRVQWAGSVDPRQNPDNREFDLRAMMEGWLRGCGADPAAPAVQAALARATDTMIDCVIPFAETAPALATLRGMGLRIGILSHVPTPSDACRRWWVRHGLASLVDFWSLSCDVGWIKPHAAHYQDALRQAGCAAGEVLHVGDHPERDVAGGGAFGFRTCLRLTEGVYPAERLAACRPDCTILHLDEVPALVAGLA